MACSHICGMNRFLVIAVALCLVTGCNEDPKPTRIKVSKSTIIQASFAVDTIFPHDSASFTQGLQWVDGVLFESTGSPAHIPYTFSAYGPVNLETGVMSRVNELPRTDFGEGITIWKDKLYQLTYRTGKGYVYDLESGKRLQSFNLPGQEGWGITHDSNHLIISDGSNRLYFVNPESFKTERTLQVTRNGQRLYYLNELELAPNGLWANVYQSNAIVRIDLKNGKVTHELDLTILKDEVLSIDPKAKELNGIAYSERDDRFTVTGKLWPRMYHLSISL